MFKVSFSLLMPLVRVGYLEAGAGWSEQVCLMSDIQPDKGQKPIICGNPRVTFFLFDVGHF